MFNNIIKAVRQRVSADKRRFNMGEIDIDLTYITDRIIAMSFPAEGIETAYRNDINDVSIMLRSRHPNHFMIYNLSERNYDAKKFDSRVLNWCGWPDHHSPPLLLMFRIVHDMHMFLLADPQNVVVVHCLAGKGRTGTIISAYLLFSGLFFDADEAMNYFAIQRSVNNWGITGPAQKRYTQYFEQIWKSKKPPSLQPLRLKSIVMTRVPKMALSPLKSGITPVITIYDFSSYPNPRVIWTNKEDERRSYSANQVNIVFPVEKYMRGDILVHLSHVSLVKEEKIARLAFHTGMIESTKVSFEKCDIDEACSDKRFPIDFTLDFYFDKVEDDELTKIPKHVKEMILSQSAVEYEQSLFEAVLKTDNLEGVSCFAIDQSLHDVISKARESAQIQRGAKIEKGGYLTKQGHKVKSWKRRWFVLHPDTLSYYKAPNQMKPLGVVKIDEISSVREIEDDVSSGIKNGFWIETNWEKYLINADNEQEREDWIEALEVAMKMREELKTPKEGVQGKLMISALEAKDLPRLNITKSSVDSYCCFLMENQRFKTDVVYNNVNPVFDEQEFVMDVQENSKELLVQVWDSNTYLNNELIGEVKINLDVFLRKKGSVKMIEWWMLWKRTAISERQQGQIKLAIEYVPKNSENGVDIPERKRDPQIERLGNQRAARSAEFPPTIIGVSNTNTFVPGRVHRPATVALNVSHEHPKQRVGSPPSNNNYSAVPTSGDHNSLRKSDGDLKTSTEFFVVSDNENQPLLSKEQKTVEQPEPKSLADSDEKKRIQSQTIGFGRTRPTSSFGDNALHANYDHPYLVPNVNANNTNTNKPEKRGSISDVELINQSTDNNYGSVESSDNEDFNNPSVEANSPSSISSSPGIGSSTVHAEESASQPAPAWHKTNPKYLHPSTKNNDVSNEPEKTKQVEEPVLVSDKENKQELSSMVPELISLCDDILASTEVIEADLVRRTSDESAVQNEAPAMYNSEMNKQALEDLKRTIAEAESLLSDV